VLAVGSNQSPLQLARKFRGADWGEIPTARVHLQDFDTVYSAHVTGYGSIAATLHASPGTCVALYVNWMTSDQLAAMHQTELTSENYEFGRLEKVSLRAEAGPSLTSVCIYMGRRGAYAPEGDIIPLSEVPAVGRQYEAKSQSEILSHVSQQLTGSRVLEVFVTEATKSADTRQSYNSALARTSQAFSSPHFVRTRPD